MKRDGSEKTPHRKRRPGGGALPVVAVFCALLAAGSVLTFTLPKQDYSPLEKQKLAGPPNLSLKNLADGSFAQESESYLSDHFPLRQGMVGLNAYFGLLMGRNGENGIYRGKDGWLLNTPVQVHAGLLQSNLDRLNAFARQTGLPATLLAVPSTGFMMGEMLPGNHKPYPDAQVLKTAQQATQGVWRWADMQEALRPAGDKPTYYRTDHHWTTQGAYQAYCVLARLEDFSPKPAGAFQVERAEGFYGTAYAKSGYWATRPDTIELWTDPDLQVQVEVMDDNKKEVVQNDGPFFRRQLQGSDPYTVFLDGNHSLVRITNPRAAGGRLLMLKDSFSHCLAPFLAAHYREIDLVDLRYYRQKPVSELVKERGLTEVLACYGIDDLANENDFTFLR